MRKIPQCTKKENKIYETEILKLKHERDTAEEVMKALRNANLDKIQISSATDKEQQIQKLNTILEKEQDMKKILVKDNRTGSTKSDSANKGLRKLRKV